VEIGLTIPEVWIEPEECMLAQDALREAGQVQRAAAFSGAELHRLLQGWKTFVDTDWTRWDWSEYLHDIAVRDTLEIVLGALGEASRRRLFAALDPIDALFRSRMRLSKPTESARPAVPFWVSGSIWNTKPTDDSP
jgi:hypothetical protein